MRICLIPINSPIERKLPDNYVLLKREEKRRIEINRIEIILKALEALPAARLADGRAIEECMRTEWDERVKWARTKLVSAVHAVFHGRSN